MGFKVFLAMYTKMTLKTTYTPLTQSHKLNGTLQKRTTNRSVDSIKNKKHYYTVDNNINNNNNNANNSRSFG